MPNEADTCRRFVVPRVQAAGWDTEPHRLNEQVTFTDGRIIVTGQRGRRRPGKRADYILRYRPDMPIAVVEAKPTYATPGDGLQQAGEYAKHGTAQFVIPDVPGPPLTTTMDPVAQSWQPVQKVQHYSLSTSALSMGLMT